MKVNKPCQLLMNVLIDDISPDERQQFALHLSSCAACRKELAELQLVWDGIGLTAEPVCVDDHLKQDVIRNITGQPARGIKRASSWKKWLFPVAACLVLLAFVVMYWEALFGLDDVSDGTHPEYAANALLQEISLHTGNGETGATGTAWLMQQGEHYHVVVHVSGFAHNQGMLRVWMVDDQERWDCGVFLVNEDGQGVLTYEIPERWLEFGQIEVTNDAADYDENGYRLQPLLTSG